MERKQTLANLVLVDVVELRSNVVPCVHDVLAQQVLGDGSFSLYKKNNRPVLSKS